VGRSGRKKETKISKALHKFGAESIQNLVSIAQSEDTPQKLRADIWKWFAEMEFGKPVAKQSTDEDKIESESIVFEGELEEWSR
jgi:hypothetical protein